MITNKLLTATGAAFATAAASIMSVFAETTGTTGDATTTGTATETGTGTGLPFNMPMWVLIVIYVVVLGLLFYFLIIRPQRKRKKEEEEMKNSICLGQDIVTIGGICGKIVNIKDDNITIQTSIDNTLIEFKSWAIREVKKEETDDAADKK
jgi:preprotein translocase subunit YajC